MYTSAIFQGTLTRSRKAYEALRYAVLKMSLSWSCNAP